MDYLGWYWQLEARIAAHNFILWYPPDSDGSFDHWIINEQERECVENGLKLLDTIRSSPILDPSSPLLTKSFIGRTLATPVYSGIRYATLRNLANNLRCLTPDEQEIAIEFLYEDTRSSNHKILDSPITDPTNRRNDALLLNLDINLPESLLIDNFAAFIRNAKNIKIKTDPWYESRRIRALDLSAWIRLGILPYLDLKTWEKENEITISNRIMADAIFSPGEAGEETVRKTTSKLAIEILEGKFQAILPILHTCAKME